MMESLNVFADGFSFGSIAASIAASLVLILSGYLLRVYTNRLRLRHLRATWFPVSLGANVNAFLTIREGPESHRSKRLSLPEVLALQNIEHRAKEIGASVSIFSDLDASELPPESHMILLGGPKKNRIAVETWNEILSKIPYNFSDDFSSLSSAARSYLPSLGQDGFWDYDYALVAKLRRGSSHNFIFLFAGCHGLGTGGSTKLMTEDYLLKPLSRVVRRKSLWQLLESLAGEVCQFGLKLKRFFKYRMRYKSILSRTHALASKARNFNRNV